ncbi:MAG TPA: lmo0937 family membrane protein [Candidatus Acidoferrales bacterium]|nr:lmo0937 family membrane protein [Anaerolineales bacterium]HLE35586.1 lmo0937 family membrane protein [Candidatus Acidoferrales bacterium]
MLWTVIVILAVLWLLGFLGPRYIPSLPRTGNVVHALLVIVVILVVLNLLGMI